MDAISGITIAIIAATIRAANPLILAVLGGIFSERSGVVNIALEGILIFSAFFAVVGAHITGNAWLGTLIGLFAGLITALILGVLAIVFDANHIIAGFSINIIAVGLVGFLMVIIFGVSGNTPQVAGFGLSPIPVLSHIPILGPTLFTQYALGYLVILAIIGSWWFLYHTPLGLRLRSSGENPAAVDTAGVGVTKMRFIGVGLSGILAGLAGAYLSLCLLNQYIEGMTVGRGFIALALVILSGWDPIRGMLMSLVFGLAQAFTYQLGQQYIPPEFLFMLPYLLTIVVLAGYGRRITGPAAAGKPYHND
jgi:general nucleoside transport system permease protein